MRDCRVNRLHLKSSDPSAARHTALLVEDGLRTASFPDDGSRLVIVRSLALGRIARSASALTVSMQIEQALQRQRTQIVHANSAEAASAEAVFFRDEAEAMLTFALQLAQGVSPTDWFWQRVIPGWQPRQSREDSFRLLLRAAIARAMGSVLVLRIVQGMVEAGKVDVWLDALEPQEGALLLRHADWQMPTGSTTPGIRSPLRRKSAASALLRRRISNWGAEDVRTIWLANMLSAIEQPLRMNDPHLSEQSLLWITQLAATDREGGEEQRVVGSTASNANHGNDAHGDSHPRAAQADEQTAGLHQTLGEPIMSQNSSQLHSPLLEDGKVHNEAEPSIPVEQFEDALWDDELQMTSAGGLFFLLNLLNRLRFGEWLIAHPQWLNIDLPRQLLAALCRQQAVAADDPIWQLIADDPHPEIEGELREAISDWLTRLSEWCVAFAHLELATIVLRPARVRRSETYIDLYFSLSQVDLRIRRVGLDFDPGWVAWLGQVVMLHYV